MVVLDTGSTDATLAIAQAYGAKGLPQIGVVKILNEYDVGGVSSQDNAWIPRFLPKGVAYEGRIHEQPVSSLERVRLPICIRHDGYCKSRGCV